MPSTQPASRARVAHGVHSRNVYLNSGSTASHHYVVPDSRRYWVGVGNEANTQKQGPMDVQSVFLSDSAAPSEHAA